MLVDALPESEILDLSRQAYQSRYEDAFDLLVPKLPQDQIQTLAQQAYAYAA